MRLKAFYGVHLPVTFPKEAFHAKSAVADVTHTVLSTKTAY
jgi:hypothetical protein